MSSDEIYYCEPVYRPPSEANSILIQATEGCTYRCAFCVSNLTKKFKIRSFQDIKKDIIAAKQIYPPFIQKIFLLDGNAMVMPYEQLLTVVKFSKEIFPNIERVSVYAHVNDILGKTDTELKTLRQHGLKMVYIGIETGNNDLLKRIRKTQTAEKIIKAFHKCFRAGITPSGTIILGLAGKDALKSKTHMIDTAQLVNMASPTHVLTSATMPMWYISCLALMIPPGTTIHTHTQNGTFVPMNSDEILSEMKIFMEHITEDVQNCEFRSNHSSNYLSIKGNLYRDRDKILQLITQNISEKTNIRPEHLRGL